jgi:hypothetical protein
MALEDGCGCGGSIGIRGCCCQGLSETWHRRLVAVIILLRDSTATGNDEPGNRNKNHPRP